MDEQRKPLEMPTSQPADYSNEINAMYDAQRQQQEASLKNAYTQNVQTLQNSKAAIAPLYNQQANDLATQYERTRRNNNMRADMNGLNTGTGSQMDLAQQSNYLNSFGQLRTAQAQAEQAVDQKIADLEINYKNNVAQALAGNDYERAAALLKEYQRRDEAAKDEARYQYDIRFAAQKYEDQIARQREQDALALQQYQDKMAAQAWEQNYKERAYNDSLSQYQDQLARQQAQDAFEREKYGNTLARQQQQDELALQQYQDALARQQAQDSYARERDALSDQRYQNEWNQQLQQYQNQLDRQRAQDALAQSQYGDQQALNAAKTRAAYGDFSGYAQLYGQDVANAMQQYWMFSNPEYAYSMGLMSPDQFYAATGQYPSGSTGGGYGGYGGNTPSPSGPSTPRTPKTDPSAPITGGIEKLTNDQKLKIAGGVMSGNPLADSNLQDAYYAYHMIQNDATNMVRNSGVDPNSEEGKAMVDAYVAATYHDPNVSLEDIQSMDRNRTANNQAAAQAAKTKRDEKVSYDWNAEQSAYDANKAYESASKYTPPEKAPTVKPGTRTPQTTEQSYGSKLEQKWNESAKVVKQDIQDFINQYLKKDQ